MAKYLDSTLQRGGDRDAPVRAGAGPRRRSSRGSRATGSKQPVLIMGHMDVVGRGARQWSVDPFAAEIKDGYLYGRGAIDDKGMLAANLETMLLLKRNVIDKGGTLSRDVIFVANSDEEQSGEWGMGWLIENHPELIRAEFALNEGGRTRIVGGKRLYVAVQNTEKVPHVVTVTAHGPGGHASIPLPGNAILRLGRALAEDRRRTREPVLVNADDARVLLAAQQGVAERGRARAMADVVEPRHASRAAGRAGARRVRRYSTPCSATASPPRCSTAASGRTSSRPRRRRCSTSARSPASRSTAWWRG